MSTSNDAGPLARRVLLPWRCAALAALSAFARCDRSPRDRRLRWSSIDITRGNVQPLPIAIPAFVGRQRRASSASTSPGHRRRPEALGPVPAARSGDLRAAADQPGRRAALRRLEGDQRAGAGGRRASPASPTAACASISGCGTSSPASRWPASSSTPRPTTGGASPTRSPTPIYERLTGEKGYFDTRVVFVAESGPKDKRIKRLAIMDQDGANPATSPTGTTWC